jgi:hypothetical protein
MLGTAKMASAAGEFWDDWQMGVDRHAILTPVMG